MKGELNTAFEDKSHAGILSAPLKYKLLLPEQAVHVSAPDWKYLLVFGGKNILFCKTIETGVPSIAISPELLL